MPTTKRLILTSIFLAVFIAVLLLSRHAGTYLELQEPLQKASAIFVLTGSTGDRVLHAYDLFEKGFSAQIIMVSDHETGKELFSARGIHLPNNADKMHLLFLALGIPDSLITIIPGNARSTKDEARLYRNFLSNQTKPDTLLLITSTSHSRRAVITFNHVLKSLEHPPVIISTPSPYTEFNAKKWWSDRNSAKQIFMEYSRLFYFWLWDRWRNSD